MDLWTHLPSVMVDLASNAKCKFNRVRFHGDIGGNMLYTNYLHVDGVRFPHQEGVLIPYMKVGDTSIFDVNAGARNINVILRTTMRSPSLIEEVVCLLI